MGFTANQWAILVLVLVLGWLLGLLSRSGGARWKQALTEEQAARRAAEARAVAAEERLATAQARIVELEQLEGRPIGASTGAAVGAAAAGQRDDLALIRGVGRTGEISLNDAGFYRFRQVEQLSPAEAEALETRMALAPGAIAREEWREQAQLLREQGLDAHRARYARI